MPAISKRFKESLTGLQPLKEGRPFFTIRENAAEVSSWAASISPISVFGFSLRHFSFPLKEEACSVSKSMILSNSNFVNVFLFILAPNLSYISKSLVNSNSILTYLPNKEKDKY